MKDNNHNIQIFFIRLSKIRTHKMMLLEYTGLCVLAQCKNKKKIFFSSVLYIL